MVAQESPPNLEEIASRHTREAVKDVRLFDRAGRRRAREEARERAQAAYEVELEQRTRRQGEAQRQADAWWSLLTDGDAVTALGALEQAFEDNQVPAVAIDSEGGRATVLLLLPAMEDLIPANAYDITPGGKPTVRRRTKTDRNTTYAAVLASQAVATAKEALAVVPSIDYVTLAAVRRRQTSLDALYVGTFCRSELETAGSQTCPLEQQFATAGALIEQRGRSHELQPLDLSQEPGLAQVLSEIEEGLASHNAPLPPSAATAAIEPTETVVRPAAEIHRTSATPHGL